MGRDETVEALSEAGIRHYNMAQKFPHLDARSCRPMVGNKPDTGKQRSPDTIEDIVRNTYVPATLDEPDCLSLSTAIIHQELKKKFPAVLRNCTPIQLAQILTAAGISRQHTRLGNVYLVKRVKGGEE